MRGGFTWGRGQEKERKKENETKERGLRILLGFGLEGKRRRHCLAACASACARLGWPEQTRVGGGGHATAERGGHRRLGSRGGDPDRKRFAAREARRAQGGCVAVGVAT